MTGNPVRRSVIEGDRARGRKTLGVPEDATLLLVFGGSLGAQHLNERVASLKSELLTRENSMFCIRRVPTALRRPSALWR